MDEIDVDHLDQQILTLIELSTSVDYTTGLLQDRIEMNWSFLMCWSLILVMVNRQCVIVMILNLADDQVQISEI